MLEGLSQPRETENGSSWQSRGHLEVTEQRDRGCKEEDIQTWGRLLVGERTGLIRRWDGNEGGWFVGSREENLFL